MKRILHTLIASSMVLVALLSARGASANAAAPYRRDPGAAGGAFVAGQTSLVVDHETLVIDCVEAERGDPECRFEALYDVSNPTDTDEEVLGIFFGAPPVVPALEATTPNVFIFLPSLSAGLGVPIQVHSAGPPRVGARAQLGVAFPLISFFVPLDVYFDDGVRGQLAFMTQLGF